MAGCTRGCINNKASRGISECPADASVDRAAQFRLLNNLLGFVFDKCVQITDVAEKLLFPLSDTLERMPCPAVH